ncbi:MAG: DoxX [Parcubacteria bacterium OLB19]|nr:MAG: DoxX [Parcubacteria bacterium OLB19]
MYGINHFYLSLPVFALLLTPFLVDAHTRWFAEGEIVPLTTSEPTNLYLYICLLVALMVLGVGMLMEKKGMFRLSFFQPKSNNAFSRAAATFSIIAGTFFMIAGTHGYLFSPNITYVTEIPTWLVMLQFAIGLMFVLGIFARVAALLLASLWFVAIPYAGVESMIENIWVLSTAFFIAVVGNDYFSLVSVKSLKSYAYKLHPYALPILRIGTGTMLIILGFTEKILKPELGLNFLVQHDWNFLSSLGVSNYLFVLMAGSTEALLGLLLALGIMTRLTTLVTAIIFTIPLFLLGPIELTGHLPHFAALIMILLFGAGYHYRVFGRVNS